jgi:uncharacterized protein (TIGR00369 family)
MSAMFVFTIRALATAHSRAPPSGRTVARIGLRRTDAVACENGGMGERSDIDVKAFVAAQLSGEAPNAPGEDLIGLRFVAWADRESTWELDAGPRHHNPTGVVQGGILCSLADVAMATAFASTLEPGETFTTLELKINYLRPVVEDTIRALGAVLHRGRRTAMLEAVITDSQGREVARCTSTVMVLQQG